MRLFKTIVFLVAIVSLSGCANMFKYRPYARSVKKQPGKSGVIALRLNHRQEDQDKAKNLMAQNCGAKAIEILEEGEVVIGSVTNSRSEEHEGNKRKVGSFLGAAIMSGHDGETKTSSETIQKKEWQLRYKCS